jgi:hypothetical protein
MNTAKNFEKNYIALANIIEFRHNPIHAGRLLIKNAEHGNRGKILIMLSIKKAAITAGGTALKTGARRFRWGGARRADGGHRLFRVHRGA